MEEGSPSSGCAESEPESTEGQIQSGTTESSVFDTSPCTPQQTRSEDH